MSQPSSLLVGFVAACVVAAGGYRTRALTIGGAAAAAIVGTAIFGFGGWRWAAVMVGFFVLSSALSRVGRMRKTATDDVVEKGSRRDSVQVLANGGVAGIIALVHGISGGSTLLFVAFLGSMAAATADTWSTEIGALSGSPPRSIISGNLVAPGTSGGVTPAGFSGALAGASVIGGIGGLWSVSALDLVFAALIAGFAGSIFDSLLGATIQQVNRCPVCGVATERMIHDCGTTTLRLRGIPGVNNDVVNGLTTLFGAAAGLLLFLISR